MKEILNHNKVHDATLQHHNETSFVCEDSLLHNKVHDAVLQHHKYPEEQGVSALARTSQFFPCDNSLLHTMPVEIEKKRIKNMYLRILKPDGRVKVTAPLKMKDEEIYRFINSKLDWIEKHREQQKRQTNEILQYETGEELTLWGRKYSLINAETLQRGRVKVIEDNVIIYSKPGSTSEQRKHIMDLWYKSALEQEIPFLMARWELKLGVKASSWKIRDMKTRWGTCNIRTSGICFNLQLAKKPPVCLEYVVVHELVHLLERSHNHVFKAYMSQYLPEWRSIKKVLNGME
jgi:predicted metal-dependent hydrolase